MTVTAGVRCSTPRSIVQLLLIPLLGSCPVWAAPGAPATGPYAVLAPTDQTESLSPAQRKVDSHIRHYVWPATRPRRQLVGALVESPSMPWRRASRLHVVTRVTGLATANTAALQAAGLDVEVVNDRLGQVQGWISEEAVPGVADLDMVKSITPAWPAQHRTGSITSEGDHASRADLVRQAGYDGTGIVVGVISDGIDSLPESQASGDLPSVIVPPDPRCRRGSGDEGTAILEIVHDLAPGAGLLFSGPSTRLEMIDAIDCLTSAGAAVLVDDIFFIDEPFFEDGPVAQAAQRAVQAGVSYHSSAGNDALEHIEMDYRPSPTSNFHDFRGGPTDNTDSIILPPGTILTCVLQWNDPFGSSANNYDLFILDASLDVVDSSEGLQSGSEDPIEIASVVNPTAVPLVANGAISKSSGMPRRLEMFCRGSTSHEYTTSAGSIFGHPAVPEVIAVGAIDQVDPGHDDVEAFSSQGPAVVQFPAFASRPKPDLAAFDGVLTTAPGFARFFGTSAAAPHSAAVAALLLSKNPTLSPALVQSALTSTAVDIGAVGFDTTAGFGRIDALAAIDAIDAPTTTTSTTTTLTSSTMFPNNTTTPTSATLPAATTSTTIPACDPDECDGDACTVGDTCLAGSCRPGSRLTAGKLGESVLSARNVAAGDCADGRKKLVNKVLGPLGRVSRLLAQADKITAGKKLSRKLSQARGEAVRAQLKLRTTDAKLSPGCVASLRRVTGSVIAGLGCFP